MNFNNLNLNKMNKIKFALIVLSVTIFLIFDAYSQEDKDNKFEKIDSILTEKLVEKLEVDRTIAEVILQKSKSLRKKIGELNEQRRKIIILLEVTLDDEKLLEKLISQLLDIEQQIVTDRKNFVKDLETYLSTKQIAKLIILQKEFNQNIRKMIKKFKQNDRKK